MKRTMATGTVKWFNSRKGFGFITPDDGTNDVFIHYTGINGDQYEFKSVNEGDKVEYDVVEGLKGLEARNVNVTEKAPFHSSNRSTNAFDVSYY